MTKSEWEDRCAFFLKVHGINNFKPYEICRVGRRRGEVVLEAPAPELLLNALKLLQVLEWLRADAGVAAVNITSWFRSPAYNASIRGSSAISIHLICGAGDVNKEGWTPDRVADRLEEHPEAQKFGIGRYKNFTHIDVRGMLGRLAPARWDRR